MVDIFQLALTKVSGIGSRTAQELIKHIGSARELFEMNEKDLRLIFKNKEKTIQDIISKQMFDLCEKEMEFMQKYNIRSYFFTDKDYPSRLQQIPDKPLCLFVQGNGSLEYPRVVSVVGSRNYSDYGRLMTEQIIEELQSLGVIVISGLAYGIDSIAHVCCLNRNIATFAVMGTGMDSIYPKEHFALSQQMLSQGGLVTEYFTKTRPNPYNFPARNRIIAGLSDAVIVIEASKTGGALLTAKLANDYDREVFAVPGRMNDKNSEGCNFLIESDRANILSDVSIIGKIMSWNKHSNTTSLFRPETDKGKSLTGLEKKIYYYLKENGEKDIDTLLIDMQTNANDLSSALLNMELCDVIISKPGRIYKAL
ncbi:MAG: DNA-processing protein DprA [Bacteroidales bacterium]|nr:DNA-processing protein DprA [Bacteroidales bacterium]